MGDKVRLLEADGYYRLVVDGEIVLEGDQYLEEFIEELCKKLGVSYSYEEVPDEFFD